MTESLSSPPHADGKANRNNLLRFKSQLNTLQNTLSEELPQSMESRGRERLLSPKSLHILLGPFNNIVSYGVLKNARQTGDWSNETSMKSTSQRLRLIPNECISRPKLISIVLNRVKINAPTMHDPRGRERLKGHTRRSVSYLIIKSLF